MLIEHGFIRSDLFHREQMDIVEDEGGTEITVYDKFIVMRSYIKCISDYQNVTFLLLVSALHNNMVAMTSFRLNVRTNGYKKTFFKHFSAIFTY